MQKILKEIILDKYIDLPKNISTSVIHALKIKRVDINHDGKALLLCCKKDFSPIEVSKDYVDKFNPMETGYYIAYEGAYIGYMDSVEFKNIYSIIDGIRYDRR